MVRSILLAALLASPLPSLAQSASTFEEADRLAEAQHDRGDPADGPYREAWATFNNSNGLDERDGCYFMQGAALMQILEIDAEGRVVAHFANVASPSAACWKATYLGVDFPKPPYAPFWISMKME